MPKVLVLVGESDQVAGMLAKQAADGATEMRFSEVELRAVDMDRTHALQHRRLESFEAVRDYDGIIVVVASARTALSKDLTDLLSALELSQPSSGLENIVFAVIGGSPDLLQRVAALGGIVVSEPRGIDDDAARARALGARTAKVIGWVRHALSHEQKDHVHHHHH